MTEIIGQFIIPVTIVACVVGSVGIVTLIIVLRDRLSSVHISRSGANIHTNDMSVRDEVVDKIIQIDSDARKSIRKATARLMILDPKNHNLSTDARLVVLTANQPLLSAAHEDYHTREIASDGGDVYLADKTNDIIESVHASREDFPQLTDERCETFVCYWFTKVVSPIIRRACLEKIAFYSSQIKRKDVSKTSVEMLGRLRDKNVGYIACIDALFDREDITRKSTIFLQREAK
jgi:hypothetical protein